MADPVAGRAINALLQSHGAVFDLNSPGEKWPPLIYASRGDKGEHPQRVRALLELGETQRAAQTIQLARQAELWCADFAYTLGVLAEARHELPEALKHYREARTLAGGEVDFIEAEAECLVALGREQEALSLIDEHAPRFVEDATLVTLGAHIAALLGDEAEATRRYQLAWRIVPDSRLIPREYGLLLVRAGRYAEAVNALSGLLDAADSEDEVTPAVRRALAVCYLELDDPDRTLEIIGDYAERHPGDTRAQVLCAKAAIGTHDMFSARRSLEIAQQRAPHHPEVLLVRAVIQWRGKDYDGASTSLREVLSQRPEDLEAHCLLAEVSAAAGDLANARVHFARALQLEPDCVWARTGLKKLVQQQPTTQLGVQRSRS